MRRLLGLVTLLVAGTIDTAHASTITFDDIVAPTEIGGDRISGGFVFDTLADHSHITLGDNFASDGSQFLGIDDIAGPDSTTFSPVGGGAFGLTSLDLGEWSFGGGELWARQVVITGNLAGGGTISQTLNLDGIFDGPGGAADFQTFTFGAGWSNLSSVVLEGTGAPLGPNGLPLGNYFGVDNIVTAPVPEPATLSLLGLGSASLFLRRRRNR